MRSGSYCVALAFAFVGVILAQTHNARRSTTTTSPAVHTDDIERLITLLQATGQDKGEFETTQQYDARQKFFFDPEKSYAFPVIDSEGFHYGIRFEYDADGSTMKMSLMPEMLPLLVDNMKDQPLVMDAKHVIRSKTRHIGQNAFGVKIPYTASLEDWYGVIVREPLPGWLDEYAQSSGSTKTFEMSMPMSVQEAEAMKPFLKAVVVGTVAAPKVYHEEVNTTAKIDSPYEDSINHDYAELKLREIRVIDGRSGHIVASYKSKEVATPTTSAR